MKLKDIVRLLNGKVLTGQDGLERMVEHAFASDLMSDVLTVNKENLLLITGLINIQAIRTAEMSDIGCIVLVRNKLVGNDIISLAAENRIVLIHTPYSMFRTSGLLYNSGIQPVF